MKDRVKRTKGSEDCAYFDGMRCKILQELVCSKKRCTFFSAEDTRQDPKQYLDRK